MELPEIEAFVAIAEHGTFTRAASVLGISQPAISRRITVLESDLGAPVFERLRQGVLLTDAGEAFLPHAQAILARLQDGIEAVHDLGATNRGAVSLALVGTLASTPLITRIRDFRENYPNITLTIATATSNRVSRLVGTGQAHLGLRYFEEPRTDIRSTPIGAERMVIVRAVESQLGNGEQDNIEALSRLPWVTFPLDAGSSGEGFARTLERQFQRHGFNPSERIEIDSLTAQKRMIEANFGLGMLPESAIVEELRLGTLEILDISELQATIPIHMLQRATGYTSPALAHLIAHLTTDGFADADGSSIIP
jgi:DNA-binding transcriptional LysR family regulator